MAERQQAEAPRQSMRAREASDGALDAYGHDPQHRPTAAAAYQQVRHSPGTPPPATLLALQRAAGNRAVNALLRGAQPVRAEHGRGTGRDARPAPRPPNLLVQRLREDQVARIFTDRLGVTWVDGLVDQKPDPAVLKAIAAMTAAYEQERAHGVLARAKAMESRLSRFIAVRVGAMEEASFASEPPQQAPQASAAPQPPKVSEAQRFLTDPAYWEAAVADLINEARQYRNQQGLAAAKALRANQENPDPIPLAKRVRIQCAMGQGVAADLHKCILHSEDFSSCTAIVMYNHTNGIGGLFHFAAGFKKQETPPQTEKVHELYASVKPSVIYIDDRSTRERSARTNEPMLYGDHAALAGFFRQTCGFGGDIHPIREEGSYFAYLSEAAQPRLMIEPAIETYNPLLNLTDTDRLPIGVRLTQTVTMVHHEPSYDNNLSK